MGECGCGEAGELVLATIAIVVAFLLLKTKLFVCCCYCEYSSSLLPDCNESELSLFLGDISGFVVDGDFGRYLFCCSCVFYRMELEFT